MLQEIVIFGTGQFAQLLYEYIAEDGQFKVVAFTEDDPTSDVVCGVPVVGFDCILDRFPPDTYKILIVIGYSERNQKRRRVFERVREVGYSMVNYIHPTNVLHSTTTLGENCIILENNVFQPHVTVGDNVGMLSANLISHHTVIEDHCFFTDHVCMGGRVTVGSGSTLGLNCTVKHRVKIARGTFVGAGVYLKSDTREGSVYEAPDPKIISPGV